MERHLERALRTTGQKAIRFPESWEDAATMAAQASCTLVQANSWMDPARIRHLAAGTESGTDHSKSVSSSVQGMLSRAGVPMPNALSSFQVQHACAGGTMALLSAGGLLAAGGRSGDLALVTSSDIARYETESTAEITQGAGAAAMLLGLSPRLLSIDLSAIGYWSSDVDDFFRPAGVPTARVQGSYSMRLYGDALEKAFLDACRLSGENAEERLRRTDLFALHTPFRNMPETALQKLLERRLGLDADAARTFLLERGFYEGIDPIADIGNMYTASLWVAVAFVLANRYKTLGKDIVGKRMLIASYGSGNTMVVMDARVMEQAPQVIESWHLERVFESSREASFEEYSQWTVGHLAAEEHDAMIDQVTLPPDAFFLAGIRKDGYREYRTAAELGSWIAQREASRDLHGPLAVRD
ncbi:MAG TPA: hydroxymethylglutaryl-CoA synthase [Spirochaetia bacterium]|nr:hydroxymethylglutaryl-CoA synthase [Spirochaetia bacterium]